MNDTVDTAVYDEMNIDLPDSILDKGNDAPTERKHSVPVGVKYGLPVFIVVISLIGYFVYLSFSDPKPDTGLVFEQEEIVDIALQEPPAILSSPVPVMDAGRTSIDNLESSLQTLKIRVDETVSLLSKQQDDVSHQNDSIQQIMLDLESNRALMADLGLVIDTMNAGLNDLKGRVDNNNQHIHQLTNKRKRQPVKARKVRPAFNLLSIDQWGGLDNVVLELQNATTMAVVGDIRAGWAIRSIQRPDCIEVVRVSDEAKATVCRKRKS